MAETLRTKQAIVILTGNSFTQIVVDEKVHSVNSLRTVF